MTREIQKMVRNNKQKAIELIRYANIKVKNHPLLSRVSEIILPHITYGKPPVIIDIKITGYNKNEIIESAHFTVKTRDDGTFKIDAYHNLKDCRSQEQKEYDKNPKNFPSKLFTIFSTKIS